MCTSAFSAGICALALFYESGEGAHTYGDEHRLQTGDGQLLHEAECRRPPGPAVRLPPGRVTEVAEKLPSSQPARSDPALPHKCLATSALSGRNVTVPNRFCHSLRGRPVRQDCVTPNGNAKRQAPRDLPETESAPRRRRIVMPYSRRLKADHNGRRQRSPLSSKSR